MTKVLLMYSRSASWNGPSSEASFTGTPLALTEMLRNGSGDFYTNILDVTMCA